LRLEQAVFLSTEPTGRLSWSRASSQSTPKRAEDALT
jgi:hypothetical protein